MKYTLIGIIIFLVGLYIRIVVIDRVPAGLNQDESAIGYNAYSLLKTGEDEHGISYPLYFKSFNDYKLPVYIYSAMIPIALFGTTEFAVRSVSLVAGIVSLLLIYLLARRLFDSRVALASLFLLSINPWHVFFSRGAYEVNLAACFILAGVYVFVESIERKKYAYMIVALLLFGLSLYTYNVTRLIAPALLLFLILLYRKAVMQQSALLKLTELITGVVILIPFVMLFFSGGDGFSNQTSQLIMGGESRAQMVEFRSYVASGSGVLFGLVFNRFILMPFEYIKNLIEFFSVRFFFINSDPTGTTNVGNYGVFHVFELVTVLAGIYALVRKRTSGSFLLAGWIGICILIVSLSAIVPHPTRAYVLVMPVTIISAVGLVQSIAWLRTQKSFLSVPGMFIWYGLIGYSALFFLSSYFLRFPVHYAEKWRGAEHDVVTYISASGDTYDRIIFDRRVPFAYTSVLYYQPVDPVALHSDAEYVSDGLLIRLARTGRYEFRDIEWDVDVVPGTLIVSHPDFAPAEGIESVATISYPERPVVLFVDNGIAQYPTLDIAYELYTISQN